jgi:heme/copper-type cytochrome/quinol oxidase subunit 1
MFIGVAILGCLINRKTNKVKVTKTKIFKPAAWVSLILLCVSIVYLVISVFADVGLSIYYACTADKYDNTQVLSTVLSAIMLIAYVAVIFGISFITERMNKNKH